MRFQTWACAVAGALSHIAFTPSASARDNEVPRPAVDDTVRERATDAGGGGPEVGDEIRTAKNALFVELGGPGLIYSANYEHTFADVFALRGGLEYLSLSATSTNDDSSATVTFFAVPVTFSYLGIGSLKHIFEVGGGAARLYFGGSVSTLGSSTSGSTAGVLGTVHCGYRYQPPDGGFFFRAGISPLISSTGSFLPWPYLSVGAVL